jgi:hypothetical protein
MHPHIQVLVLTESVGDGFSGKVGHGELHAGLGSGVFDEREDLAGVELDIAVDLWIGEVFPRGRRDLPPATDLRSLPHRGRSIEPGLRVEP